MSRTAKLLTLLALSCLIAALTACGGSSGGSPAPVTYDGPVTQAAIVENNAADLAALAHTGSELSEVVPIASLQGGESSNTGSTPVIQSLAKLALDLPDLLTRKPLVNPSTAALVPIGGTEACTVSGTFSVSGNFDDENGNLDAIITFSNCNEGDVIINGTVDLTATGVIPTAGDPDLTTASITETFNNLVMTFPADGETITVAGTVVITVDAAGEYPVVTETVNMVLYNNSTGESVKLENYTVVITETVSNPLMEISGTIYHSSYGYVELITLTPIEISLTIEKPVAGVFRINGANGSYAEVTFNTDGSGAGTWFDGTNSGSFSI